MSYKFNPLIFLGLDLSGSGSGSGTTIGGPVTGGTAGSVLFIDASGNLGQDNTNFSYDAIAHILTLTNPPIVTSFSTAGIVHNSALGMLTSSLIINADVSASANIDASKLGTGIVSNTEFNFLDGVTSSIQTQFTGKANTTLNNLASTAVNADIVPDSANTRTLGSVTNYWTRAYITRVANASGIDAINAGNYQLINTTGNAALNWSSFFLQDSTAAVAADWDNRLLKSGSTTKLDWSGTDLDVNTRKITSLVDPTAAQDAATKNYVDLVALGLAPKSAVAVATTANITLSGEQTIDGQLTSASRVLVKDQSSAAQNGIYVSAAGAWARSTDFDSAAEANNAWAPVKLGTVNAGRIYIQYNTIVTLGTDPVAFEFYNPLSSIVGGDMITVSGSTISVDLATAAGLESTNPGNVTGQLQVKLNGATLDRSASGMKVATAGITNNEVATGIDAAKIADGSVSNAEFQFINSVTSNVQTQIDNKASTSLNNLASTAVNASILPATTSTVNLGSVSKVWDLVYTNSVRNSAGAIVLDAGSYTMRDAAALSIDFTNRFLYNSAASTTLDWNNSLLLSGATTKLDWSGTDISVNTRKITNVVNPTSNQDAATKLYVDTAVGTPPVGDIATTSFTAANNQSAAANVTGLAFANASVRGFEAWVTVTLIATASLYSTYKIVGIQKGSTWEISDSFTGDATGVAFTITNAGQVQYTSANSAGFTSLTMKFRAISLPV